jgi:hypothetical protein
MASLCEERGGRIGCDTGGSVRNGTQGRTERFTRDSHNEMACASDTPRCASFSAIDAKSRDRGAARLDTADRR